MNKYRVSRDISMASMASKKCACKDLKKDLDFCLKLNEGNIDFCYDIKFKYEKCLKNQNWFQNIVLESFHGCTNNKLDEKQEKINPILRP